MGERLRWVISVDEQTQLLADRWQEQFSPLVGSNRSSLVRLVFKTLDRLGMTAETVIAALNHAQGITRAIAEHSVIQRHTEFPVTGAAGEAHRSGPKPPHREPFPAPVRRATAIKRQAGLAMEALGITSLSLRLPSNFTRRRAA